MSENDKNKGGCCPADNSGEQACECIDPDVEVVVTPCGVRFLSVDKEPRYLSGDGNHWFTRAAYKEWSAAKGFEVDPVVWFTRMGHKPTANMTEFIK